MSDFLSILSDITTSPMFGITISILAYTLGVWLAKKAKSPLVNPLLIAIILISAFLAVFKIPYANYCSGGKMIELFLTPLTAILAIKVYEQIHLLKQNWLPLLIGSLVGSAVSIGCVLLLSRLFFLENSLMVSLLPKSVTAAIAIPLSMQGGGVVSVTALAVMITGLTGAVFSPMMLRLLRIQNPIEAGVAIGTSSHALGTSKAIELGDAEGAMSSCAIAIAGLCTVILLMIF
ncbi:MAG: LrgB family protein [Clostridia bacterium]|nr:LrgB family protein [Clostridia bacterium]